MEFNTVSISDGITMGTEGMRASLVSREVIADSIELVTRGNGFDGAGRAGRLRQDDSRPAAWRSRASTCPGVLLYGGSIAPGHVRRPRRHDPGRLRGGRRARRRQDERRGPVPASKTAPAPAPAPAAVSSPPTRWRSPASSSASPRSAAAACRPTIRKKRDGRARGRASCVMALVRAGVQAARHHHRDALENAIASVATTGGSTNAVLHLIAIAHEARRRAGARRFRSRSARACRCSRT